MKQQSALNGTLGDRQTGTGTRTRSKISQLCYTLENPDIVSQSRATTATGLVRNNFERAGGSASRTAATEGRAFANLGELPLEEYPVGGEKRFPLR